MWDRVLAVHRAQLSHAVVDVGGGAWPAGAALPAEATTAATRLRARAADAQRGASWYQRARTGGLVRLDLAHPEELELLGRCGPYTTHTRVWVHDDPTPVMETGDSFDDLPRYIRGIDLGASWGRQPEALGRGGRPPHSWACGGGGIAAGAAVVAVVLVERGNHSSPVYRTSRIASTITTASR